MRFLSDRGRETGSTGDHPCADARAYLKRSEHTLVQGSGSIVGDPALKAKTLVEIAGVGKRYSGTYYVTKVTHSIGDGGYVSDFECQRNAVS